MHWKVVVVKVTVYQAAFWQNQEPTIMKAPAEAPHNLDVFGSGLPLAGKSKSVLEATTVLES